MKRPEWWPLVPEESIASCWNCAHLTDEGVCAAFPDGIPAVFIQGIKPHLEPYPGDHGVRWDPNDELLDEMAP